MIMLEVALGRGLARVLAGSVADGTAFDCTAIFDFSSPALVTSATARVKSPLSHEGTGAVLIGRRIVGFQDDRLAIVGDGFVKVTLRLIGGAAAVEGDGVLGVGRDQRRTPFDLELD
jgi:hypothetical protein